MSKIIFFTLLDSKEIDHNDVDFEKITGSLTKKQAEAVRKRIDTLNQSTKKKLGLHVQIPPSKQSAYPADVRTIFPTKTNGQPSNAEQAHTTRPMLLRKSYSEGVHVNKLSSCDNGEVDKELGHSEKRHSKSDYMLSKMNQDRDFSGAYLRPENATCPERRSSDEMRPRRGKDLRFLIFRATSLGMIQ